MFLKANKEGVACAVLQGTQRSQWPNTLSGLARTHLTLVNFAVSPLFWVACWFLSGNTAVCGHGKHGLAFKASAWKPRTMAAHCSLANSITNLHSRKQRNDYSTCPTLVTTVSGNRYENKRILS